MSAELFHLDEGEDWVYDTEGVYFAYCSDGTLYLEVRCSPRRSVCLSVDETRVLRNLLGEELPDGTSETQG